MSEKKDVRRRGTALEEAILDSAWAELSENGYPNFTLEGVAKRAGTSRPVLSRRWQSRAELAIAALEHCLEAHPVPIPDLGNVRDELAVILQKAQERGVRTIQSVLFSMREYFEETGSSIEDLRKKLQSDLKNRLEGDSALEGVLRRGVERGEIDPRRLSKRIVSLPMDLVRHEAMMTNRPVPKKVIAEILDTIFMPLVRR